MSIAARDDICHVVADIGGTNARFAWLGQSSIDPGAQTDALLQCVTSYRCADFVHFEDALEAYLAGLRKEHAPKPVSLTLAVAASVHHDIIALTNFDWRFSRSELAASLGIPVNVLNDFSAQALCLPMLGDVDLQWLQRPITHVAGARTIVGPGTGFGASTLTHGGEVLESEPGHVSFAPVCEHESNVLRELWQRYPRVSVEHLLSGPGLANLYWANVRLRGLPERVPTPEPAIIVEEARNGDPLALDTVQDFIAILGSVCGDIALSMGSLGGFYLSGGMLEKMGSLFDKGVFLSRFQAKGPFQNWCREVPIARVTLAYPGLLGCAVYARSLSSEQT
ncbi:MAG: glucokinase [Gammaproteobacteria bacterium]|nr:glucokinase [Gammaproteobacteria bacterium]